MFRARSRFAPPGNFGGSFNYGLPDMQQAGEFDSPATGYVPRLNRIGKASAPAPAQSLYGPLAQLQMRLVGNQDTRRTATFGK